MFFDFLRLPNNNKIGKCGVASKRRAVGGGGSHRPGWAAFVSSKVKGVASEASLPLTFPSIPIINTGEALSLTLSARTLLLDKNEASQYTSVNLKLFGNVLPRTFSKNHVERDKGPIVSRAF